MCSREIFTKKCRQQQIFDSDLKGAWHYNHVTFTPIAKIFMLYCRLIYMLSILCDRLTIKVKVGIPESFKLGWYPPKKTGSSHLKTLRVAYMHFRTTYASVNSTCAQAPPPRATAEHLHALSVPGVGHLQILHCPGAGHSPTPGPFPRFSHARGVLSEYNYTEGFTEKKKADWLIRQG